MQKKVKSDGSTASYYEIPPGTCELQDLISYLDANAQIGEILRACMRYGKVEHSNKLRDARKIKFYIEAEIKRLERYEPEECSHPGHTGPSPSSPDDKGGEVPPKPVMPQNTTESEFQIPRAFGMREFERRYLQPYSPTRQYTVDRFVGAMAIMNGLESYDEDVVLAFKDQLGKVVGSSVIGGIALETLWSQWYTMKVNTGR